MDPLTKSAYLEHVKKTYNKDQYDKLYMVETVRHYRVPVSIVSDWDSKFKSIFWESLHRAMNAQLRFSIFFHTQTDSLSKRVNQILEDLLRACAIDLQGSWVEFQLLVEFWYNKSNQVTI